MEKHSLLFIKSLLIKFQQLSCELCPFLSILVNLSVIGMAVSVFITSIEVVGR